MQTIVRQPGCRVRIRSNAPSQVRVKGRIVHVTTNSSPIKAV